MSEQQLWEAIRELSNLVVVQRSDLEALQARVEELEQGARQDTRKITDHQFRPGQPPQERSECGYDGVNGLCGYSRAEHAD